MRFKPRAARPSAMRATEQGSGTGVHEPMLKARFETGPLAPPAVISIADFVAMYMLPYEDDV